ncbi:hypothetical protein [Paenibacillus sp. PL91]|uniref:hypothetical protein n=1 Tax=Paenibacillus sp. PL91 TaxID=2729538 RepID=UPI00145FB0BD|nr:hypothetical protein [Paenibacillus sp. PL91]MBC9203761.1 hypothetical protein [Paenibacillus sp. PL91]
MLLIVIAAGFVLLYDFPEKIAVEYPAIEYRVGDSTSVSTTEIRIEGTLTRPLFRNHEFKGRIVVDKYKFTEEYTLFDVDFNKNTRNEMGSLTYTDPINATIQMLGPIWISGDFKKINIWVAEPVGSQAQQTTDLRISAPANSFEEAIAINKLLSESK